LSLVKKDVERDVVENIHFSDLDSRLGMVLLTGDEQTLRYLATSVINENRDVSLF
jgi:hypothetical protein